MYSNPHLRAGLPARSNPRVQSRFTRVGLESHVEWQIAMFPQTYIQNGETDRFTVFRDPFEDAVAQINEIPLHVLLAELQEVALCIVPH